MSLVCPEPPKKSSMFLVLLTSILVIMTIMLLIVALVIVQILHKTHKSLSSHDCHSRLDAVSSCAKAPKYYRCYEVDAPEDCEGPADDGCDAGDARRCGR
uniref:Uncharacterized protein n=1 Tax=Cacopsylla melanoneura TaxID=428564 RepID=A0A8D8WHZ2_9HEMI